jgi:hypothetical protein
MWKQISPLLICLLAIFLTSLVLVWAGELVNILMLKLDILSIYNPESFALAVLIFGLSILLTLKLLGSLRGQTRQLTNLTRKLAIQNVVVTK